MHNGKIALVTGGSRGLGKDMALSLARKGIAVVLTFNNNAEMADALVEEIRSQGGRAESLKLNLSEFPSLGAFVEDFKARLRSAFGTDHFDFLINNAGMGRTVPFLEVTEDIFNEFLNVHYKGVYFLTQKLVPIMNAGGGIINISTGTTRFSNPGYSVYASMKGAIEVFTKYLAKELGSKGLRANVVAPGPVETDFNNAFIRSNPQVKTALGGLSPLGRVGFAEDIGGVVAFLCSDDARWVNGQRIEVSGGINV
jgi:NAD(P)-dependent dehydrogenase (short-subunit alcohol dehydrogenase family)